MSAKIVKPESSGKRAGSRSLSFIEASVWALSLLVGVAVGAVVYDRRITDDQIKASRARDMIRVLETALVMEPADGQPYALPTELEALVRNGTISYVPLDPWGRAYVYRNPGKKRGFDLFSLGPDGEESTDDLVAGNLYGSGRPSGMALGGAGNRNRGAAPTAGKAP